MLQQTDLILVSKYNILVNLYHCMEEAEREQKFLEVLALLVAFEPLGVVDRVALVRARDVGAQTCVPKQRPLCNWQL